MYQVAMHCNLRAPSPPPTNPFEALIPLVVMAHGRPKRSPTSQHRSSVVGTEARLRRWTIANSALRIVTSNRSLVLPIEACGLRCLFCSMSPRATRSGAQPNAVPLHRDHMSSVLLQDEVDAEFLLLYGLKWAWVVRGDAPTRPRVAALIRQRLARGLTSAGGAG